MTNEIDYEVHVLEAQARAAVTWNESVKLAAVLLHWNFGEDCTDLLRFMQVYHEWKEQFLFQQNDHMLQQLLDKWPVEDMAPRIWACFHVGPYGLISRALIKKGFGVAVLLKEEVYDEQHSKYIEGFRRRFDRDPFPTDLQFIRAGSAGSLFQLKRCLEEGMHVVCFVDGEEGGTSHRNKTKVRLHRTEIEMRVGIATLAHWTNIPIRPLVLTVTDDILNVTSPEDYFVHSKADYPALMQYCFNIMMDLTPAELMQWELLPLLFDRLYVHPDAEIPADTAWLKTAIWMPILLSNKHLFIDLRTGRGVEVSETDHRQVYEGFRRIMAGFKKTTFLP